MKKKKKREDLNWHIPQTIKEFAWLALAGRYPWFVILRCTCLGSVLLSFSDNNIINSK